MMSSTFDLWSALNDWRSLGGSSASYFDSFLGLSSQVELRPAWRHLMTPTEQNDLEQLPKFVRVYRGHHEELRHGNVMDTGS